MYSFNKEFVSGTLPGTVHLIKNKFQTSIIVSIKKINIYLMSRYGGVSQNNMYDQYTHCNLFLVTKNDQNINPVKYTDLGDDVYYNQKLIANINYCKYLITDCNIVAVLNPGDEIILNQSEVFDVNNDADLLYFDIYFDINRYPK